MVTQEQLQHFADLVQTQTRARYAAQGYTYDYTQETTVHVRPGKKYIKVDVGSSGKYMIETDTGDIYGIKAYGVIHRGHRYGNITTVETWDWGNYVAHPLGAATA